MPLHYTGDLIIERVGVHLGVIVLSCAPPRDSPKTRVSCEPENFGVTSFLLFILRQGGSNPLPEPPFTSPSCQFIGNGHTKLAV